MGSPELSAALTLDLVPRTCWGSNVRSMVAATAWDRIRRDTYRAAGYRCEVCSGVGSQHPVDCHEVWVYELTRGDDDSATWTQRLERMTALCPACHEVKHFGRATVRGRGDAALAHLIQVNGWTEPQGRQYLEDQRRVWEERSSRPWALDISPLGAYGVSPVKVPAAERKSTFDPASALRRPRIGRDPETGRPIRLS
jgi:hypothetical protein